MSLTSITPPNISHRHGKTEHAPILHKELQTTEEGRELEKCSSLGKSILFVCPVPKSQLENICIIYIIWTQQVIFRSTYVNTNAYMLAITSRGKKAVINLKESSDSQKAVFRGRNFKITLSSEKYKKVSKITNLF